MSSIKATFIGILLALPFLLMNLIVSLRVEPFYSFLGSFPIIRNSSFIPLGLLLLFPVGIFIAIKPMLKKRQFYLLNVLLAIIMLVTFLILFYALGEELYRCEILQIPNCD